jgi:hypothetical protein
VPPTKLNLSNLVESLKNNVFVRFIHLSALPIFLAAFAAKASMRYLEGVRGSGCAAVDESELSEPANPVTASCISYSACGFTLLE